MRQSTRRQKTRRHDPSIPRNDDDTNGESLDLDVERGSTLSVTVDPMRVPISEVMTRSAVCVSEDCSVAILEELLLDRDLSGVPVVGDDGKLVGFVAMTDIVRELHDRGDATEVVTDETLGWGFHEEPEPRTVAHVMSPVAFELPASCPVAKAVSLMATQRVHRVPVVSGSGELLGIVTAGDIVRYLARTGRAASEPADIAPADVDPTQPTERERLTEDDRLVSLGFLAGGVGHQINNALTPMRLSLGRLMSFELSRRPLCEERLHRIELLQDVREGVARIERVIHELRAFTHADDGPSRAVNVSALLEVAIGQAAHEIRHRARLICDYATVPAVQAKPAELRQVFLNLLVNAAQAIPAGEAHLNEIRVTTRTADDGRAVIEIKDTGAGIPSDIATRIYEPFFTTRPEGKALGLGLAMSRDIVSSLDGEMTIDSVVGHGTTVCLVLPPCDVTAAAGVANESPPERTEHSERRRILIVDDDRPVAAAIAFELEAHDVVVAESGREALEILRRDKSFDVILCDLMMPEISGMDVYESIRLVDPTLIDRVVMMTGGAFTTRAGQFLSEVDVPIIEKPFHPGQLHAVVNALKRHPADMPVTVPAEDPWRPYSPPGKDV